MAKLSKNKRYSDISLKDTRRFSNDLTLDFDRIVDAWNGLEDTETRTFELSPDESLELNVDFRPKYIEIRNLQNINTQENYSGALLLNHSYSPETNTVTLSYSGIENGNYNLTITITKGNQ